jgi:hypothetical protein
MYENKKAKEPLGPRLSHWFHTHKKLAIFLSALVVGLISGGTIAVLKHFFTQPPTVPNTASQPTVTPPSYYSGLTGLQVDSPEKVKQLVTAVMIENSPDARPQSGLKDSGVVFEAIAEGGITRFLVLYQQEKPQLIGPVRSVRPYYIDWLAAFNPSVAHVGGSATALAELRNGSYRDIDQFFNAGTYWRTADRYAPHNVYTSFEKLDALNKTKEYTASEFTGFSRKDSAPESSPTASTVNVTISSVLFNSSYTYDAVSNTYFRSQGGEPHLDRESGQIAPRVVIVMEAPTSQVFEDTNRTQIQTIGSGKATIFQDGSVQEVTWNKASKTQQITFTDTAGADVPLARGQTWITVVPEGVGGVTWQ